MPSDLKLAAFTIWDTKPDRFCHSFRTDDGTDFVKIGAVSRKVHELTPVLRKKRKKMRTQNGVRFVREDLVNA